MRRPHRSGLLALLLLVAALSAPSAATNSAPVEVFRIPMIMFATWWDADAGQTSPQFQPGTDTPEYFRSRLGGFGGNPTGSLTEHYFESSRGRLRVEVDVYGPYVSNRSRQDRCYYGGVDPPPNQLDDLDPTDVAGLGGFGAFGMVTEALPLIDSDIDFKRYDNDGDGHVDFLGIIHSGGDMNFSNDPCHTWPHQTGVSNVANFVAETLGIPVADIAAGLPTSDGVLVDRVFTAGEHGERGRDFHIGTTVHEMGHALGEPDYYSVPFTSAGTGDWDVMSSAHLGNPDGSNPTMFNPASRVFQGWVTPTIVHDSVVGHRFAPRNAPPEGVAAGQPHPDLVLVPTRWIHVGDVDEVGHTWTQGDVRGLVLDGERGYVIEGWYLEYASRVAGPYEPLHEAMSRRPHFDRALYGSGLLVWHFDYWRRSNTFNGSNDAQDDALRLQVDLEEFDFYDDTQDLAFNYNRGEASDPFPSTATGVTSGTYLTTATVAGTPQSSIAISGLTLPLQTAETTFEVADNPANHTMRVRVEGMGDCTLQLFREENGKRVAESDVNDDEINGPEEVVITKPAPGTWIAAVGDFAACGSWEGSVAFEPPPNDTRRSADTWRWGHNDTGHPIGEPTGWAFTNVRTGPSDGLDLGAESVGPNEIMVDILQLSEAVDVSPGYAFAVGSQERGSLPVSAETVTRMSVPVFSNGGIDPGPVSVVVREGGVKGPVIAQGVVSPGAFGRTRFDFDFKPRAEGPYTLVTTVDPSGLLAEGSESNNVQMTSGWAGPPAPKVLVVDDEGHSDAERAYTGALAALGVRYAVATSHVDSDTMRKYDAVIWVSTSDRGPGQLDAVDRVEIAKYLDGGGRLWLASRRAIGALGAEGARGFAAGYFGAVFGPLWIGSAGYVEAPHRVRSTGAFFGAGEFQIEPFPIKQFSDILAVPESGVFGTASEVLEYVAPGKAPDGVPVGVSVQGDGDHGRFRTVTTSFMLSQATTPDTAVSLTRGVLDYFEVPVGQYAVTSEEPIVFHVDNRFQVSGRDTPVSAIVLGGARKSAAVTLYWREHGTSAFHSLPMTRGAQPGTYRAVIPGAMVGPPGIDYYIRAGANSTFDPALAASGQLAHAIAVAIPERHSSGAGEATGNPQLPATGGDGAARPLMGSLLLGAALALRVAKSAVAPARWRKRAGWRSHFR